LSFHSKLGYRKSIARRWRQWDRGNASK